MDALFSAAPVALCLVDGDGRIVLTNEAGGALFGRSPEALVGTAMASLCEPDGDAGLTVVRRADGTKAWVELGARTVTYEGRAAELVALHDVSERRAIEAAARESAKMLALGRFARSVVHDLNNFLSVILSYSEFLVTDLGPDHPSFADADEVRRSGQRAAELLRRLMAFCRPSANVAPTDLHAVLDGLREKLAERAGAHVAAELRCRAAQPCVMVDPQSVEPAVLAIVDNAREAMPSGGKLVIETADALVDQHESALHSDARPGPHVVIRFIDTGVGMEAKVREHVFEPFFTTKPRGKGIGLGLPLVFGFVSACGGHVRVASAPGQGSTIALYLPARER